MNPTINRLRDLSILIAMFFLSLPTLAQVDADFTWSDPQCSEGTVILSDASTGENGISWIWNINGETFSGPESSIDYTFPYVSVATDYEVTMQVNSSSGSDLISKTITIHPYPDIPILSFSGMPEFCEGDSVKLIVEDNPGLSYQWYIDNAAIVDANTHSYHARMSGEYKLEVSNAGQCSNQSNPVQVLVQPVPEIPQLNISGSTTFCEGLSVTLSTPEHQDYFYEWTLNGGMVGANEASFIATSSGIYTLKVTNSDNCSALSNAIRIDVHPSPPMPTISSNGSTTFCEGGSVTLSTPEHQDYFYEWTLNGGMVGANEASFIATSSGIYTLKVTNSDNCSAISNAINIVVHAYPPKPTISSDDASVFCEGEDNTALLSTYADSHFGYQWLRNGVAIGGANQPDFDASLAGFYTVQISNVGCATESDAYELTESKPAAFLVTGNNVVDLAEVIVYAVPEDDQLTYLWEVENGKILSYPSNYSAEVQWQEAGTGAVKVNAMDEYGCVSDTVKLDITIGTTGFEENRSEFSIYPNPAYDILVLHADLTDEATVELISPEGKVVHTCKLEDQLMQIDLSNYAPGIYFIKLYSNQAFRLEMIVKQ